VRRRKRRLDLVPSFCQQNKTLAARPTKHPQILSRFLSSFSLLFIPLFKSSLLTLRHSFFDFSSVSLSLHTLFSTKPPKTFHFQSTCVPPSPSLPSSPSPVSLPLNPPTVDSPAPVSSLNPSISLGKHENRLLTTSFLPHLSVVNGDGTFSAGTFHHHPSEQRNAFHPRFSLLFNPRSHR